MKRSDKRGDAALHVDGATPMQKVAFYLRHERIAGPAIAGGHNVNMAGKSKMSPT